MVTKSVDSLVETEFQATYKCGALLEHAVTLRSGKTETKNIVFPSPYLRHGYYSDEDDSSNKT